MDPLTVQYMSFTQRRLHYSFLFWACLALHFSGLLVARIFSFHQTLIAKPVLYGLMSLASFLMSFIVVRLHGLEIHFEKLLREIEEHWIAQGIAGVQRAKLTGKISSRKLVIAALFILALGFGLLSLSQF